jgi:hypothetical protein
VGSALCAASRLISFIAIVVLPRRSLSVAGIYPHRGRWRARGGLARHRE